MSRVLRNVAASLAIVLVAASGVAAADATGREEIWIEGESAARSRVTPHSWYDSVKKELLSGERWISNFGNEDGTAEYDIEAREGGEYKLWVRANPVGNAALAFRVNGGEWAELDAGSARDTLNIASDGKLDLRFIGWFKAGTATLRKGKNTVSFRMHSENHRHGAVDCFLLTKRPFTPSGSLRPGAKLGRADPGTWAFEPEPDPFDPGALLDLRGLNEDVAGRSGRVRRTLDGGFALGNGTPVRFWAANTSVHQKGDFADLAQHARFLAKRGVNMVRFHGSLCPKGPESGIEEVDVEEIERCHRLVSAMKAEGIYTTISPYWAVSAQARHSWGIEGHSSGSLPGLLFWDEKLQRAYKTWVRALLTRPNPHAGGLPLARDPALAVFQIQNEDSMLFWSLQSVKGEELDRLRAHHGQWLSAKYGSVEKAFAAWKGLRAEGDDAQAGKAGILGLWEYGSKPTGGKAARLADQARYLAETMHAFHKNIADFIRKDLGCDVLINAGNWRTANDALLLDAERWSYTANDVIAANHYVGGVHVNPGESRRSGYLVEEGDFFTDPSALLEPGLLPTSFRQPEGFPMIVSESTWTPPLSRQAEGPFLVAVYGSLVGLDGFYWFLFGSIGYDPTIVKWQVANPAILGGFPAAALIYRKGLVRRAEPALIEERPLEDVFGFREPALPEGQAHDPNRDAARPDAGGGEARGVHPLTYLVGPVEVRFGAARAVVRKAKLSGINSRSSRVTSGTGEISLDHGTGLCVLRAPRAEGAAGFLSRAGEIDCGALRISSKNEYAVVLAVALDDRALEESRRILLQATTSSRPHGWKDEPAEIEEKGRKIEGRRIRSKGTLPWNVIETRATVRLANPHVRGGRVLDPNGMPLRPIEGRRQGGHLELDLPPDALYVILE